jgi:hypothetical protein
VGDCVLLATASGYKLVRGGGGAVAASITEVAPNPGTRRRVVHNVPSFFSSIQPLIFFFNSTLSILFLPIHQQQCVAKKLLSVPLMIA